MSGPDYILIGAMKCGTSTMAAQLGAQAGVFMTDPKEPQYFSDDPVFARGPDWYAALFDGAASGDLKGEASTHYTKLPTYPETVTRMAAALPGPRLVYMIRNPMQRLVSHYIHGWSMGEISVPFDAALETVPELVEYGLYATQIAPFIDTFGPDAVLLSSLERMRQDPQAELERVARHIGFAGPVIWVDDMDAQNVSSDRVRRLPMQGLLVDNPVATALRRALVPKALRTAIRQARKMKDRPVIPAGARAGLEARFKADRTALSALFPNDPSLDLCYPFLSR